MTEITRSTLPQRQRVKRKKKSAAKCRQFLRRKLLQEKNNSHEHLDENLLQDTDSFTDAIINFMCKYCIKSNVELYYYTNVTLSV